MLDIASSSVTLSSMLPTAVQMDSENDGTEHRISVEIDNTEIYSTVLQAVKNKSVFYDLNTLVSNYMTSHQMAVCALRFFALYDSHQDSFSTTVIFSSLIIDSDVPEFLTGNYLTTRKSFVIPEGGSQIVHLYAPQDATSLPGMLDILYSINGVIGREIVDFPLSPGANSLAHFTISSQFLASTIASMHPQSDIKILSARVSHGERNLDFYFSEEQPLCSFEFLNMFCLSEIYHVFGTQKITTEFSHEEGEISGITHFYNRSSQHSVQIETAPLEQEEALWLNQFLGSPKVALLTGPGRAREVLISDITSEISNKPNEQVILKFSWSYNTKTDVIRTTDKCSIFNGSFSDSFS